MAEMEMPDGSLRVKDVTPGAPENRHILFFRKSTCFLSDSHKHPFKYPADETKTVFTVLQAYLAMMAREMGESAVEAKMLQTDTAAQLWGLNKEIKQVAGMRYRSLKRRCLLKALRAKLSLPEFSQLLLATGTDYLACLAEHRYFAVGFTAGFPSKGDKTTWPKSANVSGKLCMSVRGELRRRLKLATNKTASSPTA